MNTQKKKLVELVSVAKQKIVKDGVKQSELLYKNSAGKPVIVYAVEIKPHLGYSLAAGTVNDGYEVGNGLCQTVLDMAKAAEANGKEVICAINSGFFDMFGDQLPEGVVVKDRRIVCQGSEKYSREWWGLTVNNEIVFGDYWDLFVGRKKENGFRTDLVQATSGNHLLWKEGNRVEIIENDEVLLDFNPRSCLLQRRNGEIVLFVADGRYDASFGFTLEELQEVAEQMKAYNALNLDGGGSSQLVLSESGKNMRVINCPVGEPGDSPELRKVADSILVLNSF